MMWKDKNGKTGFKNMQGNVFLYGNMKLLTSEERVKALADGISTFVKPVLPPESEVKKFKRAKRQAKDTVKNRFNVESIKPVDFNGQSFEGGVESAIEMHFLLVLAEMSAETNVFVPIANGAIRKKTLAETKGIVIAVGNDYKDKMSIKRASIREINQTNDQGELDLVILPWPQPEEVI